MEGQRSSGRGSGVPGATDVEIEGVGLGVERRGEERQVAGAWRRWPGGGTNRIGGRMI